MTFTLKRVNLSKLIFQVMMTWLIFKITVLFSKTGFLKRPYTFYKHEIDDSYTVTVSKMFGAIYYTFKFYKALHLENHLVIQIHTITLTQDKF